ncbi:MAG: 3-oxoacyl-[acyl-carrier-protein] reductase [Candidatus Margulisiibacteriota bacterium]|nr:3-oxoacyl-[acyl-carrier-protein] reductase [Candidatus Margulisiibacteriota bacterium]
MHLKDSVVLITGAAQGIGKEIAVAFARAGAKVIITDINLELATRTANELNALPLKMNVVDPADVDAGIKEAKAKLGKIDILINNAGITKDTLFIRMKKEDWDTVINVNLTGVFNVSKAAAILMMRQRSGKIINIASIVGEMGNVGQANYSASKAGVIGLTKTLAREFAARGITVNAIAPGFIKTAMTDKIPEDVKQNMLAHIPLGKLGLPEDIAASALFLASSAADYITGQVINVNGGMLMNT